MSFMDVTSASIGHLRACYHAFLQRRLQRGAASVRTRQGFEKLRVKYQPRIQFLEEVSSDKPASDVDGEEANAEEEQGVAPMGSGELVEEATEETEVGDVESMEEDGLQQLVGVYFDPRVQQVIHDQCWPLAHQGGRTGASAEKPLPKVPEWQELEKERYFAFM
ncbi:hypothetical protein Poli38472_010388 [Pythium oligandrum]|uniref:Uncharacterized protein n=1 Tax=Pythium oligandrum TaxID=41045 RepID=A0A8K1C2Y5_PYTOL|nr:hypothetical protein Poli38472_010388 [Pythium oligandrum]|eukprot:TMW55506.1 hypothetical protein Poli38472_010388 [Pythium oligandrum]